MKTVIDTLTINPEKMLDACKTGFLNATDLADYLVARGVPFREAHHVVGQVVLEAGRKGVGIEDLDLSELKTFSGVIESDVYEHLTPIAMVTAKKTKGSTSPIMVAQAIKEAWQILNSAP